MTGLVGRTAASSLHWLCNLQIPPESVERQLQRCLGCWAAEILEGVSDGEPGDRPLGRLVELPTFDVEDYKGDPLLALAMHVALRARGLEHPGLGKLVMVYARAVGMTGSDHVGNLSLVRALLHASGFDTLSPQVGAISIGDLHSFAIDDRDAVLGLCKALATMSVWGERVVDLGELRHLLPPLAVSYAMDWDLEVVCELLRTFAYVGLAERSPTRWARDWLIDQQTDGRFGLVLEECRVAGLDPEDNEFFFLPTIRALWTLAELRCPGFLLGSAAHRERLWAGTYAASSREAGSDHVPEQVIAEDHKTLADAGQKGTLRAPFRPINESRLERHELGAGVLAPSFEVVELLGRGKVSIGQYRGTRVLLLFTDPNCGPCNDLIDELVAFDRRKPSIEDPQIIVVSRGSVTLNRHKFGAHNIAFPVAHQNRWELSRLYGVFTFPVAFLIDQAGIIQDVARGAGITALLTMSSHPSVATVNTIVSEE